jgi:hypothetical protein
MARVGKPGHTGVIFVSFAQASRDLWDETLNVKGPYCQQQALLPLLNVHA